MGNKHLGKTCPFCKTPFKDKDTIAVCDSCDMPHHLSCWQENEGCTTFGCNGLRQAAKPAGVAAFCAQCGTPLSEEHSFCPNCGTACVVAERKICAKCGTTLQDGQQFCSVCGQPVGLTIDSRVSSAIDQFNAQIELQKKKTSRLPVILGVLGVVLAAIVLVALLASPKVDYITVDQSEVALRTGETVTVECEVFPESASDAKITWSTDDDTVATVKDGVITAEGKGSCRVTARAGGKVASVSVEVYTLKDAERQAVGVYNAMSYLDENDDLDYLPTSFASLTLRSNRTGTIKVGDTVVDFTWWLYSSENDSHYFLLETTDGGEGDFFMGEDLILFDLETYTLVFQ